MTIKVTIKEPDFEGWERALEDLTLKTGLKIEQTAKDSAPVDTGNYRSEIEFDGSNTITANAKYSADIEYGTNAHTIEPNIAQALHFKKNGKDVFAKRVKHPGTKPNPVMRNAAATVQKEIPELWREVQRENGL